MLLRLLVGLLFTGSLLPAQTITPPEDPLSQQEIRALINTAAEKDLENNKRSHAYTYVQRQEDHRLNGKGETQSSESKTYEVMILYEDTVLRLIEKNDKPLPLKDAEKEEERIQKIIDKRKNESEGDRRKRLEKEEKGRRDARDFVQEISDAYNFHHVGMENLDGRESYVIDAEPRPGYEPRHKEAKILPKFRFRGWIDKTESQWVKLDAQCIDTVSFGLFLARIHKGSQVDIEQTRINHEVWLPQHVKVKIDARIALLKGVNVESDITYRDYKKFHTEVKIVPGQEVTQR